jgi:hypothetical protein
LKKAFLILILVFSNILLFAGKVEVNDRCKKAYTEIISLRFSNADSLLNVERRENPDNLFVDYLQNYIDFLKVFISEDEQLYERLKDNKGSRIDKLEDLSDNDPYKKYLIGNIRLQWAMAGTKFGDYFSTAMDIRRSFLLMRNNIRKFPDFRPQYITMGVLHIIIGMVPEKYNWILSLISLEGSVEQGTEELNEALAACDHDAEMDYLKPEILFYIAFTEMNLGLDEDNKEALMKALKPYAEDNLLLGFLRANMLMRSARNDEALQLLSYLNALKGYYPFYYLHYLEGETKIRKLDVRAEEDYKLFIEKFNGVNYLKDAQRKIAWCYLLSGDTAGYYTNISKVKEIGDDFVGVDREAQKEAVSGVIPNITLLKVRLLFDGGYYEKARAVLLSSSENSFSQEELLEKLYRMGRIAQESGAWEQAAEYYVRTIETGKGSKRYFAGNAALQLGRIYETEGDKTMALKYYKICQDLDFDEYETSIKEKAKQGEMRILEKNKK